MSNSLILRHVESQCKYILCSFSQSSKNTFTFIPRICVYKYRYYFVSNEKHNQNDENNSILNII